MPIIAVNVIKVLFVIALYGFLFYVARSMRGHMVGPPIDAAPAPTPPSQRRAEKDEVPPPAPTSPRLHVIDPDGAARTIPLRGRIVVGRSRSADLTIDDQYASERHAAFGVEGDSVWVEDLDSTNGTTIGERRISGREPLEPGTEVLIGRTRISAL